MLDAADGGRFVLVQRRRWDAVVAIPFDGVGTSSSFPNVLLHAPANSIVVLVGQPAVAATALAVDDGVIAMGAPDGRGGRVESNLLRHGSLFWMEYDGTCIYGGRDHTSDQEIGIPMPLLP